MSRLFRVETKISVIEFDNNSHKMRKEVLTSSLKYVIMAPHEGLERGTKVATEDRDRARIPRYVISVASRLVGVPPHKLRSYERADLVHPARTEGNVRLYSDFDIQVLERIVELSEQGVNLPGIKIILEMEGIIPKDGKE